ncbi:MAG: hypothetical protein ABF633_16355 [Clostridium sp.]|uniref:hypothetical protein n=1 Tax=Clostridium sp. TaxID=1506 RepID=UPI0039E9904D
MNKELYYFIKNLFDEDGYNTILKNYGVKQIFSSNPLIGVADGNDPIFEKFKEVVSADHLTPKEIWRDNNLPYLNNLDNSIRVLSIVFPYTSFIRDKYSNGSDLPPEIYSLSRHIASYFIPDVLSKLAEYIKSKGFYAVVGIKSPSFKENVSSADKLYATWSERHAAFAAGLGKFGLHAALITEAGCNVRLGSIITNAPLEITPRTDDEPYGNCLFYKNNTCKKCVVHCPINAVSEYGHNKIICFKQRNRVRDEMRARLGGIIDDSIKHLCSKDNLRAGCALCQFDVPCMDKNPTKYIK